MTTVLKKRKNLINHNIIVGGFFILENYLFLEIFETTELDLAIF